MTRTTFPYVRTYLLIIYRLQSIYLEVGQIRMLDFALLLLASKGFLTSRFLSVRFSWSDRGDLTYYVN